MFKRKYYLILLVIMSVMFVSCSEDNSDKVNEITNTIEQQSLTQEDFSEETMSDESVTKKIATEESTTEEPTTEKTTDDTSTYTPNGKTPQLMIDVLLNDEEFTFVQLDKFSIETIATWTKTMSTFNFRLGEFQDEPVEFGEYRVVDMNGDGCNEVIIDVSSIEALILYVNDDDVYGLIYPLRGVKRIFQSGIAEGATGGNHLTYHIMDFNADSYSKVIVAEEDHGVYYVEGKKTSLEEYKEYKNDDRFKDIVPYWSDYELILNTK